MSKQFDADTQGALDATRARLIGANTLLEVCELAGDEEVSDCLAHALLTSQMFNRHLMRLRSRLAQQPRPISHGRWCVKLRLIMVAHKAARAQEGYFDIDGQFGTVRGLHNLHRGTVGDAVVSD